VDLGLGSVVNLGPTETTRRWNETTTQWPMVNTIFDGVSRDSFMARNRANHVNIAYAPGGGKALMVLALKAAMLIALGLKVHCCGVSSLS
jgi:hypothetical protein